MCLTFSAIIVGIIIGSQGINKITFLFITTIFLINYLISQSVADNISGPIEKITNNINQISKGKFKVKLSPSKIYEINNLTNSLNKILVSLKLAVHKVSLNKDEILENSIKSNDISKLKQKYLFDNIKGWVWEIDKNGKYTYCSEDILNILGYTPEEIIGNNFFNYIIPEDRNNAKQIFNESGNKKELIQNLKNWNYNKQGDKVCMVTSGTPFFSDNGKLEGFRGVDIDITNEKKYEREIKELNNEIIELKKEIDKIIDKPEESKKLRLEKEKKEQKTKYEKWTEHDVDSIFYFDVKGNIIDCNNNICEKLGYLKNELLSLNMSDIDIFEPIEEIINKILITKKAGSTIIKTIHKKKDGSAILVHENLQYNKDKKEFKAIIREDILIKNSK